MTPKQKKEWRDNWPAYGNAEPVNDYLTAKPVKKEEVKEETDPVCPIDRADSSCYSNNI